MATYGLKTYKADGSTVVLQNSTKSGVFARAFELTVGNATSNDGNGIYRKEFPEYNGRSLMVFQLRSGTANWSYGQTTGGLNLINYTFINAPSVTGKIDANIGTTTTVLYIFIR
jgi:hypothetical protein